MSAETEGWIKWCEGDSIPSGIVEVEFVDGTTRIDNAGVFEWTALKIWKWRSAQDSGEMSPPAGKPPGSDQLSGVQASSALRDVVEPVSPSLPLDKYFGVQDTLNERGRRYGDFTDNARISQRIKDAMFFDDNKSRKLNSVHREALEMIAQKIARILNGDPNYKDNWHDIQGYARLAEERCHERK